MRIALVSDIHGNFPALQTVLADLEQRGADQTVFLGDMASLGPQPLEVLDRIQALGWPGIAGNHDVELLDPEGAAHLPGWYGEATRWCLSLLEPGHVAFLQTFLPQLEIDLGDGRSLLCCHGSPRSNMEFILPDTPDHEIAEMLGPYEPTVLACGHTHMPMVRHLRNTMILTVGSAGYPIERPWTPDQQPRFLPRAEYAIVEADGAGVRTELYTLPVDMGAVREAALNSGMPGKDYWLGLWRDGL